MIDFVLKLFFQLNFINCFSFFLAKSYNLLNIIIRFMTTDCQLLVLPL